MAALKSYHLEFEGVTTSSKSGNPSLTMTYDQSGRATVGSFVYRGSGSTDDKSILNMDSTLHPGSAPLRIDMNIAIISEEEDQGGWWYESYDGGKTWAAGFGGWGPSLIPLGTFGSIQNGEGTPMGYPRMLAGLTRLTFEDAAPRLEQVDRAVTRHMRSDVPEAVSSEDNALSMGPMLMGSTVDLWVSTDTTPTIRKLIIEGDSGQPEGPSHNLTWTWSRFNEDFGEVKPPPTETIR
jgi:hypothetical protein